MVVKERFVVKRLRLINVMGEVWDFWALLRGFDRDLDSRFVSLYAPRLAGDIPHKRIIELGEHIQQFWTWPYKLIRRAWYIRREIRKHRPEFVVSHHDDANFSMVIVLAISRLKKEPTRFIAWIHSSPERGYASKTYSVIVRAIGSRVYRTFDKIITPSEGNRQQIIKRYGVEPSKVVVWPNPFDSKQIAEQSCEIVPKTIIRTSDKPVIVTIGRLTEQKGQWHLIRAFASICKTYPKAQLIILGEGELREKLEKLTNDLGISSNVSFPGFVKNPYAVLHKADIFVLPSLWETFGNVLVECMLCNTPIISTDCEFGPRDILQSTRAAQKEIIEARGGILVPVPDGVWRTTTPLVREEKMLHDAIKRVLEDSELRRRLVRNGRSIARAYDFSNIQYDRAIAKLFKTTSSE